MAGNITKYCSYREAWCRIDCAIAEGFYFEAVTIEESIIADRLLSFVIGVEPKSDVDARTGLNALIKHWRRLSMHLPSDDGGIGLASRVDAWRERRNEVVHGLVKTIPGSATQPVGAFLQRCRETAVDGRALAQEVKKWHLRQLRRARANGGV